MTKTTLVTGATGKTGAYTVPLLLELGHSVRAFVHKLDERSERLAALGAEIVHGDLLALDRVRAALDGVDGAYFCYPIAPGLVEATAYFAQAAKEASVGAIVNMSQISARSEAGSNAARQHWISERVLDWSGVPVTHLRPTFFAEWLTMLANTFQADGVMRLPFGEGRHAPIAAADQARVIAAVLDDPAPHAGQIYKLFGPVEMDHHQIAAEMARVLDRPIRYEPIPVETFAATLRGRGMSDHIIQHLSNVAIDYQHGIFAGTNDVVERIGGAAGTTVAAFVAD
ncbi:MAG: NmrA family NAD(P)-binding protein, partial [Pseudomonadota bacterium]|nr:NmrA family NAD(P)-binding protein [Pseudomonadota bacterium]